MPKSFWTTLGFFIVLQKYNPKQYQILTQVLKVDKESQIKHTRQNVILGHLFIEKKQYYIFVNDKKVTFTQIAENKCK